MTTIYEGPYNIYIMWQIYDIIMLFTAHSQIIENTSLNVNIYTIYGGPWGTHVFSLFPTVLLTVFTF